ncbi:MAG: hypothetical protein Q9178_002539 [Gyalolechia marmorata]
MSFGFSVGDFLVVGTLAWEVYKNVYKAARDAPESFQKVHQDVLSLHAVLKESGETMFSSPMSLQRQQRLQTIAKCCTSVLDDLQNLVTKYEAMGTRGKWTWERFRWGSEDIVEFRLRITSSVTMLNAFMSTSQAVTQQKLEKYLREVQPGKRPGSIVSIQTVDSLSRGDRAAWRIIRKDLESIGITAEAYDMNRDFIRFWLTRALTTPGLEEHAIPGNQKNEISVLKLSTSSRDPPSVSNGLRMDDPNTKGGAPTQSVIPTTTFNLADSDPRGVDILRTSGRHPFKETTEKQQPISRMAKLIAILSFPRARLLYLARSPGAASEVSRLLQNPATRRLIDAGTIERAFLEACFRGNPESVIHLLEEGAQVNAIVSKEFFMAGGFGHDGSRVIDAAPKGASACILAALNERQTTIQILLRWGADVNFQPARLLTVEMRTRYDDGHCKMSTPLGCAVRGGDFDIVRMILDAGANLRHSIHGRTALHEASKFRIVRELLKRGADIHKICELEGTPLMVAIRHRRWYAVDLLIKEGASVTHIINPPTAEGYGTPLDVAMQGLPKMYSGFKDVAVVDLLLENGAIMSTQQSDEFTLLRKKIDPEDKANQFRQGFKELENSHSWLQQGCTDR